MKNDKAYQRTEPKKTKVQKQHEAEQPDLQSSPDQTAENNELNTETPREKSKNGRRSRDNYGSYTGY